jgi:hypothetical protein
MRIDRTKVWLLRVFGTKRVVVCGCVDESEGGRHGGARLARYIHAMPALLCATTRPHTHHITSHRIV